MNPLRVSAILIVLASVAAPPGFAADINKGAQVYSRHCASCHGAGGKAVMPGAPSFARMEGVVQPDMALLAAIRSGRNAMPAYMGILTDRDILDVIAYIRTLR